MADVLSKSDLIEITDKKTASAQRRVLIAMKIPFLTRPNGSPCVAREAAYQCLGVQSNNKPENNVTLDLDAI